MTSGNPGSPQPPPPRSTRAWWLAYRHLLGRNQSWIGAAGLLLLGGLTIGFAGARIAPVASLLIAAPLLDSLAATAARFTEAQDPLTRTWVILSNNVRAAGLALVLGAALGLGPMLALLGNGLLAGLLIGLATGPQLPGVPVFPSNPLFLVASILPHGIFELPAILLAAAWGLKLGLAPLLPSASGHRSAVWRTTARESIAVLGLVLVLLVVAAVVEANFTLALVEALQRGRGP